MSLKADILPFRGESSDSDVLVEIYVVTGKHGFLSIPESFCKECNLFYHSAEEAAEKSDKDVEIRVKSYWTRFLRPLLKGGYHAPVILVDGEMFSQGYDVPDVDELVEVIDRS